MSKYMEKRGYRGNIFHQRHSWAWDAKTPRVGRCVNCPATTRFSRRKIAWLRETLVRDKMDWMGPMPVGWP